MPVKEGSHLKCLIACTFLLLPLASVRTQDRGLGLSKSSESSHTYTGRRLALVIGNANYKDRRLSNPLNDAKDMADILQRLGFEVTHRGDLAQNEMKKEIRAFGKRLMSGGGIGLFYYAGHGVQLNGRNYLIPIGAVIEDNNLEDEAVDAGMMLDEMFAAGNELNIVVLDACRTNPFARGLRSDSRGLAVMKAPSGTIIAYATAPGESADDGGTARNGLYTQELLRNIQTPGLRLEDVFKRTRATVRQMSKGKQIPWESSSLEGDFYFRPKPEGDPTPPSLPVGSTSAPLKQPPSLPLKRTCGSDFVEAVGEAEFGYGMTKEQADQLAYEDAIRNAIRKTCPLGVSSPLALLNNSLIFDLIQYARRGIPVDTEILARETVADSVMRDGERLTVDSRRVRIRTRFVALQGDDDPDYQVTISGVEPSYIEGQEMRVKISATKDCYVYLFTVAADRSVTIFFPNRYRKDNGLKAGQTLEFPNDNDRYKGIQFVMEMPPEQRSHTREWITAVAVKRPVDFLSGTQIQEALERTYSRNETGLVGSLLAKLAQLRSGDVAQDVKEYEVLRKGPKK